MPGCLIYYLVMLFNASSLFQNVPAQFILLCQLDFWKFEVYNCNNTQFSCFTLAALKVEQLKQRELSTCQIFAWCLLQRNLLEIFLHLICPWYAYFFACFDKSAQRTIISSITSIHGLLGFAILHVNVGCYFVLK